MDKKRVIASGDDLALIKLELAPMLSKIVVQHTSKQQINNLSGYIPEMSQLLSDVKLNAGGTQLVGYLSLIVEKDTSVSFGVVADLAKAKLSSRRGLVSLIKLQLKEQKKYLASKKAPNFPAISFALIDVYTKDDLSTSCCQYILNQAISAAIEDSLPRSLLDFEQMVANAKQNVTLWSVEFNQCLERIAKFYSQVKLKMAGHVLEDEIILQLDDLIYPEFFNYTKWQFLANYPRYLQAMLCRMERYSKSTSRDKVISEEVNFIYNKWYNYVEELEQKHKVVSSELYAFKYKIEELRISLFAQELKTLYPVSSKRLLAELHQLYLNNLI
jgi:ATP-dependent helicase HrpA